MTVKEGSKSLFHKYVTIVVVVSAYWIISISTVFINKTLFSSKVINLKAPIFVTWTQCLTSILLCLVWKKSSKLFPNKIDFPNSEVFKWETVKLVLPVSILFVLTISFGNLSLSFVEVSFYFVSRSLTTVFNVILTYLILHQKTSKRALLCCLIIICGFLGAVDQENFIGTLSPKGTLFGVLSSILLSYYSIYTKKVLPAIDNKVILLTFYNNIYSSLLFIPLIFINGEYEQLKGFNFGDLTFWILMTISGIFGFLITFVTTLQIEVTSPLTHNISGTAKACAQTVIATYWYQEEKPILWWSSNFLILFGSAAYARTKQLEMAQKVRSYEV